VSEMVDGGWVSRMLRGGSTTRGGKSKVRVAGVFSRHLVAVMAGVLPFAGGEYLSRVDRVVRRIATARTGPELLDVLVPQERELPVARGGRTERHLGTIQRLAPGTLERVGGDASNATDAAHVEEAAVGGVEAGLVLARCVALAARDSRGGARRHHNPRHGDDRHHASRREIFCVGRVRERHVHITSQSLGRPRGGEGMTAAGVVRVEERARFRCQRCQECFHDASSLVKHKIAHRKADTERAQGLGGVQPGNGRTEGLATDGTKSGVRHPRETLTRKDTNSHLTHTHRDLMRKGDELMREMDRVAVSVATEKESSSSMGRLHATSRTSVGSLTQRLRWEKETRARRDGIAGWSPTPSPEPSPGPAPRRAMHRRDEDEEDESPPEKAPTMPSLDTHRPPAPRYGSEVPDEPFPSPPTHSPIHRYDDDTYDASSPTDDEEDEEDLEEENSEYFEDEPIDAGLFLGSKPIALRKAPAQIRREEARARREAARAAALEATSQGKPRSEAGSSRPSTVGDENGKLDKPPPRWQGGTVIRRAKGSRGAFPDHASDEKDVEKEFEKDVDRPEHWGDPGGKLLQRARNAAVKIERAERVRAEKRLAYVAKHGNRVVTVVGELPGEDAGVIGVKPGHEVDDDDDSDDEDEGEGNDTAVRKTRLVMYDALVRARDVRVLTERAEAELAARREEEEWRSSHSVSSGDEEVEEEAKEGCIVEGRDDVVEEKADSVDAKGAEGADTAVHETLTSSTEDAELAEFERLEREVLAEVGAG